MGNQPSTFLFFCLKDFRLSQFLNVPGTSDHIFEAIDRKKVLTILEKAVYRVTACFFTESKLHREYFLEIFREFQNSYF